MIQQVVFLVLTAVTLGGALGVVTSRSVFGSALWLILSFIGVAGLYVTLQAGFLAVVQILIYVGAISVLILFTVMLTRQVMSGERLNNSQWYLAAMVAILIFGTLAVLGFRADWPLSLGQVLPAGGGTVNVATDEGAAAATSDQPELVPGPVAMLGRSFVTDYLLAFEVASAILLVALVGAVVIARE